MKLHRRFQYVLFFIGTLAFCTYMVDGQKAANEIRHADRRDAFMRLYAKNRIDEAHALYVQLIEDLQHESTKALLTDQQRAAVLASNATPSPDNLVWRYYSSVNKELESRDKQKVARNNAWL